MSLPNLKITAGPFTFKARLETKLAPKTCAVFARQLPFKNKIIHVRWSGEGVWIPFGADHFDIPHENATSYPAPGQMILYPGGVSEAEYLIAYGSVRFASKVGQLAGNHFLTITNNLDELGELGRMSLQKGAQKIVIEEA